jgi:hypothetical protein
MWLGSSGFHNCGNIQGKIREHSMNIQGTFSEHAVNMQYNARVQ